VFYPFNQLVRVLPGFLPLLPLMAAYHLIVASKYKGKKEKNAAAHIAAVYVFCFTLVFILNATGIPAIQHFTSGADIKFALLDSSRTSLRHYTLNALLFIPVGLLLPMLWKRFEKWPATLLCGFLFSLSIEIIQLFSDSRITDVDDLLMNTVGTLIGFIIAVIIKKLLPKIEVFSVDNAICWKWESRLCFCFAWISMLFFRHFAAKLLFGAARP